MSIVVIIAFSVLFFGFEILYFFLAERFNIIDHPNDRSSHQITTIRGGGIIFIFSSLLFFFVYGFQYPYFILGLLLIALISFLDDIITLNNKARLMVHLISVMLMFFQWGIFYLPLALIIAGVIISIGIINAYNFMDGINGLTALYSFITIITLSYLNNYEVHFISNDFLLLIGLALLVFGYFNFRKIARCFAGDVGSIVIALILIFFIGELIIKTQNLNFIFLLLVYGLDAVSTILFRLYRKENIFKAHRSHFYQCLANEKKIPQLYVSIGYAGIQLLLNIVLFLLLPLRTFGSLIVVILACVAFISIRFYIEGKTHLFNS
jgi:UDP-N-acetylmuramyl pentapeptide phosphotransferase/UDP-N-acetylglucosamine-1-phosphate transferase